MDFQTYIDGALGTAKPLPSLREDFEHAALGLSTESGEFNTAVKRVCIYGKQWDDFLKGSTTITLRANALEELADTCWYIPLGLKALGYDKLVPITDRDVYELLSSCDTLKKIGMGIAGMAGTINFFAAFQPWEKTVKDREVLGQMLTSMVILIDRAAAMLGSSGDAIRYENYIKLNGPTGRYANGYSDAAAEARADKAGADATVS